MSRPDFSSPEFALYEKIKSLAYSRGLVLVRSLKTGKRRLYTEEAWAQVQGFVEYSQARPVSTDYAALTKLKVYTSRD